MTDLMIRQKLSQRDVVQKVINHKNRLGCENSIYTAVKYFVKSKYTKIIFLDADGDHPSSFIKTFDKDLNQFDIV